MVCAKLPLWAGVAPLGGCLSAGGHAAGSALAAAGRNGGVSVCGVSTAGGIRVTNEALGDDLRCPVSLHLGAQHPGAPRASCRWLKHAAQGWCGAAIVPAGTGSRRWLLGWHRGTSRTQLQHPPTPCPRLVVHCTQGAVWLLDQLANPGPPHPPCPTSHGAAVGCRHYRCHRGALLEPSQVWKALSDFPLPGSGERLRRVPAEGPCYLQLSLLQACPENQLL